VRLIFHSKDGSVAEHSQFPPAAREGHVELNSKHQQQVAVDDDLQDDERFLALSFLLIHGRDSFRGWC
jgi:hypothetical protein